MMLLVKVSHWMRIKIQSLIKDDSSCAGRSYLANDSLEHSIDKKDGIRHVAILFR